MSRIVFFSIEIFLFGFFPPYKIAGINPLFLNSLVEPDEVPSLFIAFKLFIYFYVGKGI